MNTSVRSLLENSGQKGPIEWIVFDVVGTLIYANPSVADAYFSIGRRHGSQLSYEEVCKRFRSEFRRIYGDADDCDDNSFPCDIATDEQQERRNWQRIVSSVFSDLHDTKRCFEELFEHFAQPESWCCFEDVADTLAALDRAGFRMALASNFDSRLHRICEGIPPLSLIGPRLISSEIGYRKPSPSFYRALIAKLGCPPDRVVMVGDDWKNDIVGAARAGISAIYVKRGDTEPHRKQMDPPDERDSLQESPRIASKVSTCKITRLMDLAVLPAENQTESNASPWVAIQRNPISGTSSRRNLLLDLIARLREHGITPRLYSHRDRLDRRMQNPHLRRSLLGIVAAGGDGTVGDVMNRHEGLPIAVLPLGTENLLARYLQIPRSGRAVADLIAEGHTRRVDVGQIGGRKFLLMASFGFDADVVRRAHERRRSSFSQWNYIQPILASLRNYQYPQLHLKIPGQETRNAKLCVIVNIPSYALRLPFAKQASASDGQLDLRLFGRGSTFQMLRYFYKVAMGTHERLPDVQSVQATQVRIESDEPVPVQVDGDPAGWTPAEVSVLPSALEVFAPKP